MLSFGIPANKKLQKLTLHVSNRAKDHGNIIWSTNDQNETMHKDTKKTFKNTNKRQDLLHEKLIYKRIASRTHEASVINQPTDSAECRGDFECHNDSFLLVIK